MRLPWQRAKTTGGTDPGGPHAFVETNDPGVGAVSSGAGPFAQGGTQLAQLAMTTAMLRATRCGLPGCGKPREDPVHAPEE